MSRKYLLILLLFLLVTPTHGEHQTGLYVGFAYSRIYLNNYDTIYHNLATTTGVSYRYNHFISNHFLSFIAEFGGGSLFSKLQDNIQLATYNLLLEFNFGVSYGYAFGEYKQHQVTFLGASALPRFYGLFEESSYTEIGDTEIEWYQGLYMPLSIGVYLPSYRYVGDRFFVGFSHQLNLLVAGHRNLNSPNQNLLLNGIGYALKLEIGYTTYRRYKYSMNATETSLVVKTNGNRITLSFIGNVDNTDQMTVELFAVENINKIETHNLVGYGANLPIFDGRVQFTKHWQYKKNFFDEELGYEPKYIVVRYKNVDKDGKVISEKELIKDLAGEETYEE